MTLNIAWSDSLRTFAIVDSAVSYKAPATNSLSSLGQLQYSERSAYVVAERMQKIVRVGDTLVALCGDVQHLAEFVRAARQAVTSDPNQLLEWLSRTHSPNDVVITILLNEPDRPLLKLSSLGRTAEYIHRGSVTISGSADEAHSHLFISSISEAFQQVEDLDGYPADSILVIGLALCVAHAAKHSLVDQLVGGMFFGGHVSDGRPCWQPDITYIQYTPTSVENFSRDCTKSAVDKNPAPNFGDYFDVVQTFVRDDALVVSSSINNAIYSLMTSATEPEVRRWSDMWVADLRAKRPGECDFLAFIPKGPGPIVVLRNNGAYIRQQGDAFLVSGDLVKMLLDRTTAGVPRLISRV